MKTDNALNNLDPTLEDEMNYLKDKDLKITSMQLAEECGKLHKNVLRDIRQMRSLLHPLVGAKISEGTGVDKLGRVVPLFTLNREACIFMLAGYSKAYRITILNYFFALEETIAEKARLNIAKAAQEEAELRRLTRDIMGLGYTDKDEYDEYEATELDFNR